MKGNHEEKSHNSCVRFDDFDFIRYCSNLLNNEQVSIIEAHIWQSGCQECLNRLNLWSKLISQEQLTPHQIKEHFKFTLSSLWQLEVKRIKQQITREMAEATFNSSFWSLKQNEIIGKVKEAVFTSPLWRQLVEEISSKATETTVANISRVEMEEQQYVTSAHTTECTAWDDKEFFKFWLGKLCTEESAKLANHWKSCEPCRARFILHANFSTEVREMGQVNLEKVKKEIAQCVNDTVKENLNRVKTEITKNVMEAIMADMRRNGVNNVVNMKEITSNPATKIRQPHITSLRVAALFILTLIPALGLYQIVIKPYLQNKAMQAQAAAQTKSIPPSRYEQINKGIDDYLTARKLGNLAEANQILEDVSSVASEMASMTGDKFGMDVVSYYRSVPNNAIEELQKARKLRAEVEATIPSDNYDSSLAKLGKAKSTFEELGAQIDIETTNIQIVRNLTNANRLQEAEPLAKTGLDNAVKSTHIFSQSSWLYWKGQIFYRSSRRDMAIPIFEQSQQIANTLGVIDLELHPARALADIYYEQNDNVRALQQSRDCLPLAILVNNRFLEFQFTQIAGMSLLSLNDKEGAEKYLQRGLEIAKQLKDHRMTSISYTYLGLAKAEQRHFNEAENYFSQSFEQMKKINDEKARLIVEYQNTGYYARIQMLADNPTKSVDLYNKALMLAEKANIQANLELSQLHQGLSEALSAQGNSLKAKAEMLKAIDLWDQARKYCEKGNSMRSFAASRKSLGESCS